LTFDPFFGVKSRDEPEKFLRRIITDIETDNVIVLKQITARNSLILRAEVELVKSNLVQVRQMPFQFKGCQEMTAVALNDLIVILSVILIFTLS